MFFLRGDLGSGKTSLTRGIVAALGDPDDVTSPSFTIQNTYIGSNLRVEHFDFYRLSDPGIMSEEFREVVNDSNAVVIVEWGEVVEEAIQKEAVVITIEVQNDESRVFHLSLPDELAYLLDGVKI